MKKTNILILVLNLIFLVIFNVMFFMLGDADNRNASVWISYVFIHFAYIMLILTPVLTRKGKSSSVFGISIYSISAVYFVIQLVVGVVFILVNPERFQASFIVQLCLLGIYGIVLIVTLIANEKTADAEEKRESEIAYVKDASVKLKGLSDNVQDRAAKRQVERVFDAVYSSPVKSHPDLAELETKILTSISGLEDAVYEEITEENADEVNKKIIDSATALLKMVNERNEQLKTRNR